MAENVEAIERFYGTYKVKIDDLKAIGSDTLEIYNDIIARVQSLFDYMDQWGDKTQGIRTLIDIGEAFDKSSIKRARHAD